MGIICEEYLRFNLDGPVPAGRDNVFVVEVNDVHSRSVPNQHSPQVDLGGADHVPDGDAAVLAAGHHHPVLEVEAEVEHGLAVVDQRVDHLAGLHVPDPHRAVAGPGDDHLVVILQAQHRPRVPGQHLAVLLQI